MEIAKEIYNSDLKVRVVDSINDSAGGTAGPIELSSKSALKSVVVKFRLDFDNAEYVMQTKNYSKFYLFKENFSFYIFLISLHARIILTKNKSQIITVSMCKKIAKCVRFKTA